MIENIPESVIRTIRAAARDVVRAVKGGAYNPTKTEDLANTLEKFMISMVAPSYPKVRASWIDRDLDKSWLKQADQGAIVDVGRVEDAIKQKFKDMSPEYLAPIQRDILPRIIGKGESELQKLYPDLFEIYKGTGAPAAAPALPSPAPAPEHPPTPMPLPSKEKKHDEIAPAKQELMKPGQVKPNPQDAEFEDGVPVKPMP